MSDNGHTSAKKQGYSCNVCKKSFSLLNRLTQHKKVHESEYEYKCSVCGKAFAQKPILDVHIARKHIEKKPHGCDQCGKTFATAYDLQRHIKTHTGSKPYQCDSCDKAFSTSGDLIRHKRIHTGEKPYRCKVCARPFARVGSCLRHQKTHSEGKKHKCDICNEAFTRSWNLQVHKRSHTGEKPYRCDKCTKSFSFLRVLKSHKKIHVKTNHVKKEIDKTVSPTSTHSVENKIHNYCGVCCKEFKRKANMQQHVKMCRESFSSSSSIAEHRTTHSEKTNEQTSAHQKSWKNCEKITGNNSSIAAFNAQPNKESDYQCVHCHNTFYHDYSGLEQYKARCNECAMKCDGEERTDDLSYFAQAVVEPDDICDTAYVCSLCGISFETNILLNNHITDNHEEVKQYILTL